MNFRKKVFLSLSVYTILGFFCTQQAMRVSINRKNKMTITGVTEEENKEVQKYIKEGKHYKKQWLQHIFSAIKYNNVLLFKFLIAYCDAKNCKKGFNYRRCIHQKKDRTVWEYTIFKERFRMTLHLLEDKGVNANQDNPLNMIFWGLLRCSESRVDEPIKSEKREKKLIKIAQLLLKNGAYIDTVDDVDPVALAVKHLNPKILELLIENGKSQESIDIIKKEAYIIAEAFFKGFYGEKRKRYLAKAKYLQLYSRNSVESNFKNFTEHQDFKFIW